MRAEILAESARAEIPARRGWRAPVAEALGLAVLLLMLPACQPALADDAQSEPPRAQRIALAETNRALLRPLVSPDTSEARWTVDSGEQAIHFGSSDAAPLMTLDCQPGRQPPQIRIIRHAPARAGEGALFPVIGNGLRSRFLVDAAVVGDESHWEGIVDAADPMLDVFTGPNSLTATLPGRGMLRIGGSRIPGEFIRWCRAGGDVLNAQAEEEKAEARG